MVANLLKLRFSLLKGSLSGSTARLVGFCFAMFFGFAITVGMALGLGAMRGVEPAPHRAVPVIMLSIAALLWICMSIFAAGVDDSMDPGKFALFPLRARQLMPGMLAGALIDVEGVTFIPILIGFIWCWSTSVLSGIIAAISLTIGLLALMLTVRLISTALNSVLHSRRFRDLSFIVIVLAMSFMGIAMQLVSAAFTRSTPEQLQALTGRPTQIIGWTPIGWAAAIPAAVDQGAWLGAALRFVFLLVMTALLWRGWEYFLDKALTSPLEAKSTSVGVKATSWVDRIFPDNARGAIAARSLRYWRRDPRHLVALAVLIIMPLLFIAPSMMQSENTTGFDRLGSLAWAPVLFVWMIGPTCSSELSYDGSALATHIISGVRGRDDRLGRVYSILALVVPILIVWFVLGMALSQRWWLAPATLGCSIAIMLTGIGAASWISTIWNAPSPPPGSNPFAKGSGAGAATWLGFFATMILTFVPAIPAIIFAVMSATDHSVIYGLLSLACGVVLGGLMLWLGIYLGGRRLDKRWPELLKQVTYTG